MKTNLPVTYQSQNAIAPATIQSVRYDVPLGTAAWQTFPADAQPVFENGDLYVGELPNGKPFGLNDDRHTVVIGGTRGGKGASFIIPNLCEWAGSAFVIDPKGENAIVTARRRGSGSQFSQGLGQRVCILDPFGEVQTEFDDFADLKCRFNPLDLIGVEGGSPVDDAGRIAESLIPSDTSASDPFFDDAARSLLRSLTLHVASSRRHADARNLVKVRELLVSGDKELQELAELNEQPGTESPSALVLLFAAMERNPAYGGAVARTGTMLADMYRNSPRTAASVFAVARTHTDFIDSPPMQHNLSASDFSLAELKIRAEGMSLFVCLPHRYLDDNFRWFRLITTLVLGEMERTKQRPAAGRPVLMVLDEFAALRRMKVIEDAAAQIAGSGVKMMFVVQTLVRLKDIYKDNWEGFIANCSTKIFFSNDDHFTRDYASKLIGDCEVVRQTANNSKSSGGNRSSSFSTTRTMGDSRTNGHSETQGFSGGGPVGGGMSASNTSSHSVGHSMSQGVGHSMSQGFTSGQAHGSTWSSSTGQSETIHKRPLVTPDEVGRIFGDPAYGYSLVLASGHQPVIARRTFYFSSPLFGGKFDPHPSYPTPPDLEENRIARRKRKQLEEYQRQLQLEQSRREQALRVAKVQEIWERKQQEDERRILEFREKREKAARDKRIRKRTTLFVIGATLCLYLTVLTINSLNSYAVGGWPNG